MSCSIAQRFKILDSLRHNKLERSRYCASLTVPSLLPPEGWTEQNQLDQPFSSTAARGVTSMASRMLSALLPLNDMPFFKFEMGSGADPELDISEYLENLSYQVYTKLSSGNLRETIYQSLQHLLVIGDVMLIMEDDMNFRIVRLDRYVCRRNVYGDMEEVIFIEYETLPEAAHNTEALLTTHESFADKKGYREIFTKALFENDVWTVEKEDKDGLTVEGGGEYTTSPYVFLRWSGVPGENYGRSHCEDLIGDIKTLEAFTEALTNGVAAASMFWMGIDPTGITEVDDVSGSPMGAFVSARQNEIFTISPSQTMQSQIQSTQAGVQILRSEVGKAFLMDSSSIPQGDRVTATAVRMIGQELEHVLGGAFSSIARDLMEPIVRRVVFLMTTNGEIDERLKEMFTEEGILSIAIITGLQALSRDTDLQKLMQMGEMVRNLPEQAAAMFKWDEYGSALITALGFNSTNWIKSEDTVRQEQLQMAQAQAEIEGTQQANQAMTAGIVDAATDDIKQTGGQGIQQILQQGAF